MPDTLTKTTREDKGEESLDETEKLEQFKDDISDDADLMWEQSQAANEDMRFIHTDSGMYDNWFEDTFRNRSKLVFDSTSPIVNRFMGNWYSNKIGVDYKPNDSKGKTSVQHAQFINNLYRSDFEKFSGNEAIDNAVHEAAICGYGAFKLGTEFDDEEDGQNDSQHVIWVPIYNAFQTVFWDSAAQRADKRDSRWVTRIKPFTKDSFEKAYPGEALSSAYTPWRNNWNNTGWRMSSDVIYVGTRYEIVTSDELFFVYFNKATGDMETLSEKDNEIQSAERGFMQDRDKIRERVLEIPHVDKTVFSGQVILKKTRRISGKRLPIIPMYAFRGYVDTVEWYKGLVRSLKDPNRVINVLASQILENAQSSGQNVPIFYPEQIRAQDIRDNLSNQNNKPYMVIDHELDKEGNFVNNPIQYRQVPQLDQNTQTMIGFVQDYMIRSGQMTAKDVKDMDLSGRAVRELRKLEDMDNKPFMANVAKSIEWSGEVYQGMATEVYNDDRLMDLLARDGTESQKSLEQIEKDEKSGRLITVNALEGKKFRSHADTGPQFDTEREETMENLKGIAELFKDFPGAEKYMPAIAAGIVSNMNGVGLEPIKKIARLEMINQRLIEPETDEEKQEFQESQQQQQPNAQEEFLKKAGEKEVSEARSLDASAVQKIADSQLKGGQLRKILTEIPLEQAKTISEIRKQNLEQAQQLPLPFN